MTSYYAVKKGDQTGVFDNWNNCSEAIKGYSGAVYKKFATRAEAEAFLEDRDLWSVQIRNEVDAGVLVAFTDGSFDKGLKRYSYGVYFVLPDKEEGICGFGSNEKYISSANVSGEILGVLNALDWAVSNNFRKIKIYHDYEGLAKWVNNEWNANSDAAKMYVAIFNNKYRDIIDVEFEKVPAHSNISYNDKADELAKFALINREKVTICGDNWFSIPFCSEQELNSILDLLKDELKDEYGECRVDIASVNSANNDKLVYKVNGNGDCLTITLYKTGKKKILIQGKDSTLFRVLIAVVVELYDKEHVEQILENAYRIHIDRDSIEKEYGNIEQYFPKNYPNSIKRLLKQSIINISYSFDCEDYSGLVFPCLKALEGHIKFLLNKVKIPLPNKGCFSCFNSDRNATGKYQLSVNISDVKRKLHIEECYNYYKSQRDTLFHYGDVVGSIDNTRFIDNKKDADEIVKTCIDLIIHKQ